MSLQLLPHEGSAVYVEAFLGAEEHEQLSGRLTRELDWQQRSIVMFGRQIPQPRLTAWYGEKPYTYSGLTWPARPLVEPLEGLRLRCESAAAAELGEQVSFNSVLANLYRDGSDSMGWHSDDEKELGDQPVIASLSLGAPRRFRFRHRQTRQIIALDLAPGSLLLMSGQSQSSWQHEVPKQRSAPGERINLTFRLIRA